MNSEKVKEIKKALKCCSEGKCEKCLIGKKDIRKCVDILLKDTLTLINELESENERLLDVIDIDNEREYRKKFNDEWRKEYQKELDKQGNGHIAGYPDFDLVYKLYFEQKDRIAELEKENETKTDTIANLLKNQEFYETEKLKQFAERLKKRTILYSGINVKYEAITADIIDEVLKEYEE